MTRRILIDVDTQFDFMAAQGALYVPAPEDVGQAIRSILMSSDYDAVVGCVDSHAYDAWEFTQNGGPFPAHCIKGQRGWLRANPDLPNRQRFIPMTQIPRDRDNGEHDPRDARIIVGEAQQGHGQRTLLARDLAVEAVERKVGLYFEKEVYSLFDNELAEPVLQQIGMLLAGNWDDIQIDVIGYCTGGYCVDAAVQGLCKIANIRRAAIRVLSHATAAIGGAQGMARSKAALTALGATWVERD